MATKQIKDITLDEIQQIVGQKSAWKLVNQLIQKGYVSVYENLYENYIPKKEKYVSLHPQYQIASALEALFTQLEKAPKQLHVLLQYLYLEKSIRHVPLKLLLQQSDATWPIVKAMISKSIVTIEIKEVDRLQYVYAGEKIDNTLNDHQLLALEKIQVAFTNQQPVLLHGITGSGKTHVYFKLIENTIATGKQVLYLLPEIALTAQIIQKLQAVFGAAIGIYHSRFSHHERVEVWHKIKSQHIQIVIGARSALLLPFKNLGLIIVDEEHDASYKQQDPSPRYHARDAAIVLAKQHQAQIILGSATPSIESYYNAQHHKYALVTLDARYGKGALPDIHFIDMKLAKEEKQVQGFFSATLIQAIQSAIASKKQVILFQNRRGYAPFLMCSLCGWTPECKYCDVSLTYHKATDKMHCHYCGNKTPVIRFCQACGGNKIIAKSFGTERIEEDIQRIFPNARVHRFDWDAMRSKNKYQEIISAFEKQEIDILVGTQMVVKGLDFEHVQVVGVLSADSLLAYPDFRVHERVFQLLEQVGGRAGRKEKGGAVYIQTYNADREILQHVLHHDYEAMYTRELQGRADFQYPPFTRMIAIILKHKNEETVEQAGIMVADELKKLEKVSLFGPAEPSIARIKNLYIREIIIKINRDSQHVALCKQRVKEVVRWIQSQPGYTSIQVQIDVDPY